MRAWQAMHNEIGNAHYELTKIYNRSYESACREIAYTFNLSWSELDAILSHYYRNGE